MPGINCGVVVVEERDARGSSVGRSRRNGTVVEVSGDKLLLIGEVGTETYTFRKGTCKLFRSFIHEGKLTVCTPGMRHQIMISETDPELLTDLCGRLLGENIASMTRTARNENDGQNVRPSRMYTTGSRIRTVAPLGNRDQNSRHTVTTCVGKERAMWIGNGAKARAREGFSNPRGRAVGVVGRGLGTMPGRKERRMGTPTKSCVESRVPEKKSARRISPCKGSSASAQNEPSLSNDQQRAVDLVLEGKSLFFTGCAGTGKSLVLRRIISSLAAAGTSSVYATATTGLAACQLKGSTLQQFAGIGKARGSGEEMLRVVRKRPDAVRRWKAVQVLIVDEISMLDGDTFDALEYIARELRQSHAPFGGIRLVLCGDFFQLPPVSLRGEPEKKLCFEAKSWAACVEETVRLKLVFRQRDNKFVKLLSRIRWGQCTPEVLEELQRCRDRGVNTGRDSGSRGAGGEDGIEETQLLTHKADVLRVNEQRLAELEGTEVLLKAEDKGSRADLVKQLDDSCSAPAALRLKVGAQVILVKNLGTARGLANGSRGVVVRFTGSTGVRLPVVRFTTGLEEVIRPEEFPLYVGGVVVASRRQLPLALAWALSVHKSQGMSLDRASVCLSRAFEYGQAYVALSRVRSLESLSIIGSIDPSKIRAHPRVMKFYRDLAGTGARTVASRRG